MLAKIITAVTVLNLLWLILTPAIFIISIAFKDATPPVLRDIFILCIQCGFGIVVTSAIALGFGIKQKNPFGIMINGVIFFASSALSSFVWLLVDAVGNI